MQKKTVKSLAVAVLIVFGLLCLANIVATYATIQYYSMHMEIGYMEYGKAVLPEPEWSGPNNTQALNEIYNKIEPGVVEQAVRNVIELMTRNGRRGVFLAFPFFAEKYSEVLKEALNQGHIVGIHMHENWKALTSKMDLATLTNYIRSEKKRLEEAIGKENIIFSYGPGVELDEGLPFPTRPLVYGSLTDEEKREFFQAIADAGFKFYISALEYQRFAPPNLVILDNFRRSPVVLIGLPHSYELHSRNEVVWTRDKYVRNLIVNQLSIWDLIVEWVQANMVAVAMIATLAAAVVGLVAYRRSNNIQVAIAAWTKPEFSYRFS